MSTWCSSGPFLCLSGLWQNKSMVWPDTWIRGLHSPLGPSTCYPSRYPYAVIAALFKQPCIMFVVRRIMWLNHLEDTIRLGVGVTNDATCQTDPHVFKTKTATWKTSKQMEKEIVIIKHTQKQTNKNKHKQTNKKQTHNTKWNNSHQRWIFTLSIIHEYKQFDP